MAAYRKLVYETPGFTDYFFSATPIREIAELNIGSRPASRKATDRIEDLRAIPWSFSWGQCRLTLPGWYGFGSAVAQFLDAPGGNRKEATALLQKMYRQWPFFRALLSNMDMVLAKTDLAIASRYAELVPDKELRERIFKRIGDEYRQTLDVLETVEVKRSVEAQSMRFPVQYVNRPNLDFRGYAGTVQGGVYPELRRQCALVIDLGALDGAHGSKQCKVARFLGYQQGPVLPVEAFMRDKYTNLEL